MGLEKSALSTKSLGKIWVGTFVPQMQTHPIFVNLDSGWGSLLSLPAPLLPPWGRHLLCPPCALRLCPRWILLVLRLDSSWSAARPHHHVALLQCTHYGFLGSVKFFGHFENTAREAILWNFACKFACAHIYFKLIG